MAKTNYELVLQNAIYDYENQHDSIVSNIERLEQALPYIRNEERRNDITGLITEYEKSKELLERLIGFLDDSEKQMGDCEKALKKCNELSKSLGV